MKEQAVQVKQQDVSTTMEVSLRKEVIVIEDKLFDLKSNF